MGADPKLRRSLREKSCEANGRETLTHEDNTIPRRVPRGEYDGWGRTGGHGTHGTHIAQTCHAGHAGGRRWSEQQQFYRSASARLPRTRHPAALDPDDDDYAERSSEQDSRDGERKIQQVRFQICYSHKIFFLEKNSVWFYLIINILYFELFCSVFHFYKIYLKNCIFFLMF